MRASSSVIGLLFSLYTWIAGLILLTTSEARLGYNAHVIFSDAVLRIALIISSSVHA